MINVFCCKIVICISLKVWESQSGKELLSLTGHSDAVYCCAFSSNDAKIVSCSADHTVKVLTQKGMICNFSNSLIIHQVKTKKITSMKEVWIPGLN